MKRLSLLLTVLIVALLMGCAPLATPEASTATVPSTQATERPATAAVVPTTQAITEEPTQQEVPMNENTPQPPGGYDPALEPVVSIARQDLAQRTGVLPGDIVVVEAAAVVWPNPALGCPQPNMRYKQVPVDGVLIRLQAAGKIYEYHGGGTREPFLCEQTSPAVKSTSPGLDPLITPPGSEDQ